MEFNKTIHITDTIIIGQNNKCFIIAEACDNHLGRMDYAKKMVDIALLCGADAIKFQHHLRDDEMITALSTVCTHLGCTPNWLESDRKFKCPCHGSGFRSTGINFEGPAPRPLERYRIYLANDGQIIVDKNKNFKYEKGEWNRMESFLKV